MRGARMAVCGDADVIYFDQDRNFRLIEEMVGGILKRDVLPVVLGGDHPISNPYEQGFQPTTTLSGPVRIPIFSSNISIPIQGGSKRHMRPNSSLQKPGFR